MVEHHQSSHSLNHRHGTGHHTRVVTPFGLELPLVAMNIEHRLLAQLGSYGLECRTEIDGLSVTDTPLHTSRAVGKGRDSSLAVYKAVVLLRAPLADAIEAAPVVEALAGIDAQHGIVSETHLQRTT